MSESHLYRNALPTGSTLQEYRIESVLGAGGFGITYLCRDTHLDKRVAIKEYFPAELVVRALDGGVIPVDSESEETYASGLQRFIQEARTLAKFSHPNIVRVNRYFEANATGYMVMEYEEGKSLSQLLGEDAQYDQQRMMQLMNPLLSGLAAVHAAGFLHRDIKPSNIFVRTDGNPLLLDFGSARQTKVGATKSLTSIVTPGFAPLEQYSGDGTQGAWTDIYAMAGVMLRMLLGENPPDAVSRIKNDTVPGKLGQLQGRVSLTLLRAIEWALMPDEKDRPRTVQAWRSALEGKTPAMLPKKSIDGQTSSGSFVRPSGTVATSQHSAAKTAAEGSPSSTWRWTIIGALALLIVVGYNMWSKQRDQQREADAAQATARNAKQAQEQVALEAEQQRLVERERQLREQARQAAGWQAALQSTEAQREQQEAKPLSVPVPPATQGPEPGPMRSTTNDQGPDLQEIAPTSQRRESMPSSLTEAQLASDPMARQKERDLRAMDANGDGQLSRDEVRNMPMLPENFDRIDTNRDGRISLQEFLDFRPSGMPSSSR